MSQLPYKDWQELYDFLLEVDLKKDPESLHKWEHSGWNEDITYFHIRVGQDIDEQNQSHYRSFNVFEARRDKCMFKIWRVVVWDEKLKKHFVYYNPEWLPQTEDFTD